VHQLPGAGTFATRSPPSAGAQALGLNQGFEEGLRRTLEYSEIPRKVTQDSKKVPI
jgi:hypothetical protein